MALVAVDTKQEPGNHQIAEGSEQSTANNSALKFTEVAVTTNLVSTARHFNELSKRCCLPSAACSLHSVSVDAENHWKHLSTA